MRSKVIRLLALFVLVALSLFPGQVFAADDIEVIMTTDGNMECRMTTFEGAGDNVYINPDLGGLIPELNAKFIEGWYTAFFPEGYDTNNPSLTVAFWTASAATVTFEEPVAVVSFYYSSQYSSSWQAFGETGNLVATSQIPVTDGEFSIWEFSEVTVGENIVTSIRINVAPGYMGIDDFQTCRIVNQSPEDAIIGLIDDIGEIGLHKGIENSLVKKLENALKSLEKGNDGAAINKLYAFINEVEAQNGKKIEAGNAESLIEQALAIIQGLSDSPTPPEEPPPPGDGL